MNLWQEKINLIERVDDALKARDMALAGSLLDRIEAIATAIEGNDMDIILRFTSVHSIMSEHDVKFFSLDEARREVKHRVGHFEITEDYALSDDGVIKVEIVAGELELEDLRS